MNHSNDFVTGTSASRIPTANHPTTTFTATLPGEQKKPPRQHKVTNNPNASAAPLTTAYFKTDEQKMYSVEAATGSAHSQMKSPVLCVKCPLHHACPGCARHGNAIAIAIACCISFHHRHQSLETHFKYATKDVE